VEILVIDTGPGHPDIDSLFADGVSTAGTLGIGLGALRRLANRIDVHSMLERGTVLAAVFAGERTAPVEVPMIDGTLIYVAADQTVDQQTSVAYYVVRAAVPDDELSKVPRLTLNAGEPADLLILNRPRLAIDYILSPFIDSMHMAGHEQ
jgi:hypothetical protein